MINIFISFHYFFFLLLEEFGREKCIIVHIRNHLDSTNQDFNGIKLE